MAAKWLETMPYEHQRKVRQWWVDYLAEEIRREKFIQGTQIHLACLGSRQALIDGQHRLWAVVSAGIPQSFTILKTQVQSEEEIGWLYGSTDIGLHRTASDLFGALDLPAELGMTKTQVDQMGAAVRFMRSGCTRQESGTNRMHREDIVNAIRLYTPYGQQFFELITGCETRMAISSSRAATLSLALLTLRFSAPYAAQRGKLSPMDFWRGVVFDDGIQVGDPRKLANRHLLTTAMSGGQKITTPVSPAHSTRYLGFCFNAFIGRQMIKFTRVYDQTAPLAVYGVPKDHSVWLK